MAMGIGPLLQGAIGHAGGLTRSEGSPMTYLHAQTLTAKKNPPNLVACDPAGDRTPPLL
jgi:hypothetical protein